MVIVSFCDDRDSSAADPASTKRSITGGDQIDASLSNANAHLIRIDAQPGDYVRGQFSGRGVTLSLVDEQGNHQRRLANGTGSKESFYFIHNDGAPYRLKVQAGVPGATDAEYTLSFSEIIPKADQVATQSPPASPRLRTLQVELLRSATSDVRRSKLIETFWDTIRQQGTPLVEFDSVRPPLGEDQALVTFLYRGAKHRVQVFSAPSGNHDEMQRLGDSDVWYASYRVPRTARIGYKIAPDVPRFAGSFWEQRRAILATAQLDPLNPNSFPERPIDRFAGESIIALPDAPHSKWLDRQANVPAGSVQRHEFSSEILGNRRDVYLYRPFGYAPEKPGNGLLVVFDGRRYLEDVSTAEVLDRLIFAGEIIPTAAILISNPSSASRAEELPCNPKFASFLSEELLPWAEHQQVTAEREKTVVVGASYGGLAAAYMGLKLPQLFGHVYSQSGSFWWSPGSKPGVPQAAPQWLTRQYAKDDKSNVRFRLEAGHFEDHGETSIFDSTRHLRDVLEAKGYDVDHQEYATGHGYYYWRHTFPDGLIAILGKR
ncbi:alpha/beta hydrolase-fold protein [Roseiconus lacunae]|uniref:alpha/beta hydrolase-fold protein n=1 Tax=Roseiconus lacunae TaxID=2605694 RepID=UPI0011F18418|nr:alpha/beta hydrolase-fold protein [Roseiconus lacunae]